MKTPTEKTITVKLNEDHLKVINAAMEVYTRLKMGQVQIALDTLFPLVFSWEEMKEFEKAINSKVFPELNGSYYGIYHPKLGDAKIGHEIQKTFEEFLAVKNNDGYWDYSFRSFDGPLFEEVAPEIVGFDKTRDFPIPKKIHKKLDKLIMDKEFEECWKLVRKNMFLPDGDRFEIKKHEEFGYAVQIKKPRKKTATNETL